MIRRLDGCKRSASAEMLRALDEYSDRKVNDGPVREIEP